jgi:lipid-A-disaccharide synthase-like uncharacterized protein
MNVWQALGWLGQACFFARFLVQWLASERAGTSVVPKSFWWISLCGSVCVAAYALLFHENYVMLGGYVINGAIAARNLAMDDERALSPTAATGLALAACALLIGSGVLELRTDPDPKPLWIACGTLGQAIWSSRFVVQWWASERAGASHFPRAFWWLSLAGNTLLLAYAIHLGDPVYVAGFLLGPLVQVRNLMLGRARA